ncbi:MAG: response regulator [Pseudomonadota bacterium]
MSRMQQPEILLVEDSQTDAELVLRALALKHLDNRVVWVKDGAEALDYLFCQGAYSERPQINPCFMLLDLKMPKMNGTDVLRRLKSDEQMKIIPVVMLTSSAEEKDMVQSYQLGANSYIVKPVAFDKFMSVIPDAVCYWGTVNQLPHSA